MTFDLAERLVCPSDRGVPLTLATAGPLPSDRIESGSLTCPACGREYPIEAGIPRLLPDMALLTEREARLRLGAAPGRRGTPRSIRRTFSAPGSVRGPLPPARPCTPGTSSVAWPATCEPGGSDAASLSFHRVDGASDHRESERRLRSAARCPGAVGVRGQLGGSGRRGPCRSPGRHSAGRRARGRAGRCVGREPLARRRPSTRTRPGSRRQRGRARRSAAAFVAGGHAGGWRDPFLAPHTVRNLRSPGSSVRGPRLPDRVLPVPGCAGRERRDRHRDPRGHLTDHVHGLGEGRAGPSSRDDAPLRPRRGLSRIPDRAHARGAALLRGRRRDGSILHVAAGRRDARDGERLVARVAGGRPLPDDL